MQDIAQQVKNSVCTYNFAPVDGVTVEAHLDGSLGAKNGAVTYGVIANQADKLIFKSVPWIDQDKGALMTRPANITFVGAAVDTSSIYFNNVQSLNANQVMTLVADFGSSVGTITGDHYTVGTTLEGEGKASLSGNNLIFTVKTGTGSSDTPVPSGGSDNPTPSGDSGNTPAPGGNTPAVSNQTTNLDHAVTGAVKGGNATGNEAAIGDNVHVTDSTVNGSVTGGNSENGSADHDTASVNNTNVHGNVMGAESQHGTASDNKAENSATYNTVNISGNAQVDVNVYGGYGGTVQADNNTVNLSGGTVSGAVYGGYSESGTTKNNTVNLYGTANVANASLYGGNREVTGNTLNIGDAASKTAWAGGNQQVKNIAGFENINFQVVPWSASQ